MTRSFRKVLLGQEDNYTTNQDSSSAASLDESSYITDSRNFHGTILMVTNVPSFDVKSGLNHNNSIESAHSFELVFSGSHAFLFVIEFDLDLPSSDEDDKQLIDLLIDIYGADIFRYLIFVFTNLEKLQARGMPVNEYMEKRCSQVFRTLMAECKRRCILFNTHAPPNAKDASIAELLLTINQMLKESGGQTYSYHCRWQSEVLASESIM